MKQRFALRMITGATALTFAAVAYAVPANDNCSGATAVIDGDNTVNNIGATQDTQVPCASGGPTQSGADVWYTYTASETGVRNFEITNYRANADGTGQTRDSILTIYSGCGGTLLACDDNSASGTLSKIYHFPITSGTTYLIRFSNRGTTTRIGAGTLNIAPPRTPVAFDDCALATPFVGQGDAPFNTVGLTNSDTQGWDCNGFFFDGWFAWTPSLTGVGVVDGCDATNAGQLNLSIYDACGNAPLLCSSAFQDDPNPFCTPKIAYDVIAGHTYYVRFGVLFAINQASGNLHFAVRPPNTGYVQPVGALVEPGNCTDDPAADLNGGCAVAPTAFTPLHLCDTYVGTANARIPIIYPGTEPAALSVDEDWYEIYLDHEDTITITGQSEFPPQSAVRVNCGPSIDIVTTPFWSPSTSGVYSLNMTTPVLSIGTYYYFISPQLAAGTASNDCSHNNRYWFHISGTAACPPACVADFDHSGAVNVTDIFAFLRAWFAHNITADIDGNSTVNVSDIFAFLRHWFARC